MKQLLIAMFGVMMLTGCTTYYDYYKGGVRYTQDGDDCVFRAVEHGRRYSEDVKTLDLDKRVVYKNTKCRDLYRDDNMGQVARTERVMLTPVVKKECSSCPKKCTKKKYVFVK